MCMLKKLKSLLKEANNCFVKKKVSIGNFYYWLQFNVNLLQNKAFLFVYSGEIVWLANLCKSSDVQIQMKAPPPPPSSPLPKSLQISKKLKVQHEAASVAKTPWGGIQAAAVTSLLPVFWASSESSQRFSHLSLTHSLIFLLQFSHLSPAIISSFSCNYHIFRLQFSHLSPAILSAFFCNSLIFLLRLSHFSPTISHLSPALLSLIFLMQFSHLSPAILYSCSCNYLICTSFSCISLSFY